MRFLRACREVRQDQQRERGEIMVSMKTVMVILMTILFSLLFISRSPHSDEIYKWVDEKGTVNFSDNPGAREFRGMVEPKEGLETVEKWELGKRNLSRDDLYHYLKASPDSPRKETTHSLSPSRGHHDLSNDRDYQEMLKKIGKSQYYQRDYYKPRSGVPHARKGEINPAAEKATQELKGNIDQLVRDPRWETSSEYRDEVKKYFKGHFNEKDEYFSRTGTVVREAGEIKVPRSETKSSGSVNPKASSQEILSQNPKHGEFLPRSGAGVINPRTGEYYPPSGPNAYINLRTGDIYPKSGSGAITP